MRDKLSFLLVSTLVGPNTPPGLLPGWRAQSFEHIAIGISGFAVLLLALTAGGGLQAVRVNPGFRLLCAVGSLAGSILCILPPAKIIGGSYFSYGAGALAVFLLGLMPAHVGKDRPQVMPALLSGALLTASMALLLIALSAGAESADYAIAFGMVWYGAFMVLNERRSADGSASRQRIAYAGLALLALGILIMARIMAISVSDAQNYLDTAGME